MKTQKQMSRFKLKKELAVNIKKYADQYEAEVGVEHWREENGLISRARCIRFRKCLKKSDLMAVALWKTAPMPFVRPHIEKNDKQYVKIVTEFALSTKHERARIQSLTLLDGVSWPVASAVLHLYHTDCYPILDKRALRTANAKVPNTYNYKFWEEYVAFCRDTAKCYGVCMRTLDRAMWCYDKITNG